MARINLLTIHWGNSYGGVMQTYATIKLLKEMGHKVTLINLCHPKRKNELLKKHDTLISWFFEDIQFFLFRLFYFGHKTRRMYTIKDGLIPPCDYTIVGSDQVWNNDITGPIQMSYFLDFVKHGTLLSFASSFGKSEWDCNEYITNKIKICLDNFKAVSVREESGVEICKKTFNREASLVLDPTMIYGKYNQLVKNNKPYHEIFPFLLGRNKNTDIICARISKELGLPLHSTRGWLSFIPAGPKKWLDYMKNSDFIITDSFHGLAFGLIFQKKFIVLCANEKKFTRLHSLLKLLKLEDRYIKSYDDLLNRLSVLHSNIDYKAVEDVLNAERSKSIGFLTENLS